MSRIDKFNQLVRSLVTLGLVAGFIYSSLIVKTVSQETFNNLVLLVVTWWFARDQAHAAVKDSAALLKPPEPASAPKPEEVKP